MLLRTRLAVSLVVTFALFLSATAQTLSSLIPHVLVAFQSPLPDFSESPGAVNLGLTPSVDPVNRNGVWNSQLLTQLAAMQTVERSRGAGGPGSGTGSGEGFSWEGSASGGATGTVNTNTGNRSTSIPIVAWGCAGDLGVSLTLYHNSQSLGGPRFGNKWRTSLDFQVFHNNNPIVGLRRVAIVRWPDGTYVPYVETGSATNLYQTEGGGLHDKLVRSPAGESATWMVVTKDQTKYLFDGVGYLTGIKDRRGNSLTINRALDDRVLVIDSTGRILRLNYSGDLLRSVVDPTSRTWTFAYDGSKNLTGITYPALNGQTYTRTFGYDGRSNITSETDLRGKTWTCGYDGSDRLTSWATPSPLNETVAFAYGGSQTSYTLPAGGSVRHNYSSGQLVSEVDPAGFSTAYGYDTARNMTTVKDKRGNLWRYQFDANGNVLKVQDPTFPVGSTFFTREYTYNATNDVLSEKNQGGHLKEYVYDAYGKLLRLEYRVGPTIGNVTVLQTNTYDAFGQLATSSPLGQQPTTYAYNAQGDVTNVDLSGGSAQVVGYDTLGQATSTRNLPETAVTYTRDSWGRIGTITNPDSSTATITYDLEGNVTNAVDENGHGVAMTYDEAGRLKTRTNALSDVESYGYNANGWLTSVTNGRGKLRTYGYTIRGDLKNVTLPDGFFENSTYDANGNVAQHEDRRLATAGQKIVYTYNVLDALTKVDYPTTTDATFAYDPLQRIATMTDATGTTTWTYDNSYEWLLGAGGVNYTYDTTWKRATTNDGSGATTYGYSAGKLASVTNPQSETTSWTYDVYGRIQRQTLASGAYTTYGFDQRGRINAIAHMKPNGTSITTESYVYDPVGNLTSKTIGGVTTTYTYDGADQLLTESRPGYSASYTYDRNGNRLTKTVDGVTESYAYDDGDKLLSAGTKTYSYDLAGRTSQVTSPAGATTVGYDDENRVVTVSGPGISQSYQYNGLGARMRKNGFSFKRDGVTATSPVLSDGQATYTPGISERRGGATQYMHLDYQGTNRIQTDNAQTITNTRRYDAYGLLVASTGSAPTPFGFAGGYGYQQDETGLQLLGHRFYDPSTGRFLTRDPVQDGRNWYVYCDNNPTSLIDPAGSNGRRGGRLRPPSEATYEELVQLEVDGVIADAEAAMAGTLSRAGAAFWEWYASLPPAVQRALVMIFGFVNQAAEEAGHGPGKVGSLAGIQAHKRVGDLIKGADVAGKFPKGINVFVEYSVIEGERKTYGAAGTIRYDAVITFQGKWWAILDHKFGRALLTKRRAIMLEAAVEGGKGSPKAVPVIPNIRGGSRALNGG